MRVIDQWIIDHFQAVVDLTQKSTQWWVATMSVVYALSGPFSSHFGDMPWIIGGFIFLFGFILYYLAIKHPDWTLFLGSAFYGRIILLSMFTAYWVTKVVIGAFDGKDVPTVVVYYSLVCIHYFAACKPPRPRKKTESKLVFNP